MVDQSKTCAAIAPLLEAGMGGTVDLVVEERLPAVMSVDAAIAEARVLLGKSLVLVAEGNDGTQRFAIDPATLSSWLTLIPVPGQDGEVGLKASLDEDQVRAFVQQAAKQLNRPAFNATLDFDPSTNQVVVLEPSQTGQSLDVEASVAAISRTGSPACTPVRRTPTVVAVDPETGGVEILDYVVVEDAGISSIR